ncbi:hypothetical protein [Streptacidiphilus sp. PAMC 29251]
MTGTALMADTETTRLEAVLAGIRDYLTGQLEQLNLELAQAEQAVVELDRELNLKQASVNVLTDSRDLLVSTLAELDETKDSGTVARSRRSRKAAASTVTPDLAELVQGDGVVGALPDSAPATQGQQTEPISRSTSSTIQDQVLEYLNTTPGIHKVAEIATAVSGPDASPSAVQGIRRALAALLTAGHAEKSAQSGTAFYSATAPPAAPAQKAGTTRKKAAPKAAKGDLPAAGIAEDKSSSSTARIPAARKGKPGSKAPAAKQAAPRKNTRKSAAAAVAGVPEAAPVSAAKPVRADRPTIVATLRAASQPQSATDLSRTVMGDQWKPSDATNFRNVLKSLAKEGTVAIVTGERNRSHYTAAPTA